MHIPKKKYRSHNSDDITTVTIETDFLLFLTIVIIINITLRVLNAHHTCYVFIPQ